MFDLVCSAYISFLWDQWASWGHLLSCGPEHKMLSSTIQAHLNFLLESHLLTFCSQNKLNSQIHNQQAEKYTLNEDMQSHMVKMQSRVWMKNRGPKFGLAHQVFIFFVLVTIFPVKESEVCIVYFVNNSYETYGKILIFLTYLGCY